MSREPSVLGPSIWMMVISLLLCWLPGFGPLIAGYVGGKRAGDVSHAFLAALLPMLVLGVTVAGIISLIFSFTGPVSIVGGLAAGTATLIYIAHLEIALIAGAIVGGLLADK